jgi:prepilin-type processing-associated H-X9-DG protein
MHGSYRAVSGRAYKGSQPYPRGYWDTYEPNFWAPDSSGPIGTYRGFLHGTGTPYNGFPSPAQTGPLTVMGSVETLMAASDGTSNTLMVGECTFFDVTRRATFWAYTYASYNQSSLYPESRLLNAYYNKCWAAAGPPSGSNPGPSNADHFCKRGWGSGHTSGINFVMGDGSVRFVSYSVDMNTLTNMATMSGGEVATLQ